MPKCKKIYLYRDSHLPEEGWLQSCFYCYTFTSNTIDYTYIKRNNILYECNVHLCPQCEELLHRPDYIKEREIFESKCSKYLRKLFSRM